MGEVRLIGVAADDDGVRLDRWLRRRWPDLAQGQIHKLARGGQLRVDGVRVKADTRLAAGSTVRVPPLPEPPVLTAESLDARDIALARSLVLYEDDAVLALNKPAGLAVQGGTKTHRHLDGLLGAWGDGERRPRLVHRLDRDTSGVLILGKTAGAAARLASAFAGRLAEKTYWAIVAGAPQPPAGTIDIPLIKEGLADRERMAPAAPANPAAQVALTNYATLARSADGAAAWLALRPHTGRTHQIRAHLLAIGHPILGDPKYATEASRAASQGLKLQLHAHRLKIPHPAGGTIDVTAPSGPRFSRGLAHFGFDPAAPADLDPFA